MEGDGQVRAGGGELKGAAAADVAAQDPSGDLVAVGDGQHVAVADVQPEDRSVNGRVVLTAGGVTNETTTELNENLSLWGVKPENIQSPRGAEDRNKFKSSRVRALSLRKVIGLKLESWCEF